MNLICEVLYSPIMNHVQKSTLTPFSKLKKIPDLQYMQLSYSDCYYSQTNMMIILLLNGNVATKLVQSCLNDKLYTAYV